MYLSTCIQCSNPTFPDKQPTDIHAKASTLPNRLVRQPRVDVLTELWRGSRLSKSKWIACSIHCRGTNMQWDDWISVSQSRALNTAD